MKKIGRPGNPNRPTHRPCEVCGARSGQYSRTCSMVWRDTRRLRIKLSKIETWPPPIFENAKWLPLTRGAFALVDDADYARFSSVAWTYNSGYAGRNRDGRRVLLHREVLGLTHDDKCEVDHKDRNPLNCRKENLRIATRAQNTANMRGRIARSGYRGVAAAVNGRWYTKVHGKFVGAYDTAKEAAEAYDVEARKVFGEFAVLNF
jgi:hypothetical protein